MPVSVAFIKELDTIDPKLRRVLLSMLEELERQREESVTKKEFNELKEIVRELGKTVKELAEAQKHTQEQLTSFEKQTEENFRRVWQSINELAEAQKQTEAKLNELAEAQKKSEERLNRLEQTVAELAEAQKQTEKRLNELAEAQRETERILQGALKRLDRVEERLEGLSDTVGYTLENRAYKALPSILSAHGLKVEGRLLRRYVKIGKKERQLNIYGYGRRNRQRLLILGEAKVRPSKKEISRFERLCKVLSEEKGLQVFKIFVAHDFPPAIEEELRKKGILPVWSYELE